jgi:hypothetical protein
MSYKNILGISRWCTIMHSHPRLSSRKQRKSPLQLVGWGVGRKGESTKSSQNSVEKIQKPLSSSEYYWKSGGGKRLNTKSRSSWGNSRRVWAHPMHQAWGWQLCHKPPHWKLETERGESAPRRIKQQGAFMGESSSGYSTCSCPKSLQVVKKRRLDEFSYLVWKLFWQFGTGGSSRQCTDENSLKQLLHDVRGLLFLNN